MYNGGTRIGVVVCHRDRLLSGEVPTPASSSSRFSPKGKDRGESEEGRTGVVVDHTTEEGGITERGPASGRGGCTPFVGVWRGERRKGGESGSTVVVVVVVTVMGVAVLSAFCGAATTTDVGGEGGGAGERKEGWARDTAFSSSSSSSFAALFLYGVVKEHEEPKSDEEEEEEREGGYKADEGSRAVVSPSPLLLFGVFRVVGVASALGRGGAAAGDGLLSGGCTTAASSSNGLYPSTTSSR